MPIIKTEKKTIFSKRKSKKNSAKMKQLIHQLEKTKMSKKKMRRTRMATKMGKTKMKDLSA